MNFKWIDSSHQSQQGQFIKGKDSQENKEANREIKLILTGKELRTAAME